MAGEHHDDLNGKGIRTPDTTGLFVPGDSEIAKQMAFTLGHDLLLDTTSLGHITLPASTRCFQGYTSSVVPIPVGADISSSGYVCIKIPNHPEPQSEDPAVRFAAELRVFQLGDYKKPPLMPRLIEVVRRKAELPPDATIVEYLPGLPVSRYSPDVAIFQGYGEYLRDKEGFNTPFFSYLAARIFRSMLLTLECLHDANYTFGDYFEHNTMIRLPQRAVPIHDVDDLVTSARIYDYSNALQFTPEGKRKDYETLLKAFRSEGQSDYTLLKAYDPGSLTEAFIRKDEFKTLSHRVTSFLKHWKPVVEAQLGL